MLKKKLAGLLIGQHKHFVVIVIQRLLASCKGSCVRYVQRVHCIPLMCLFLLLLFLPDSGAVAASSRSVGS